MLTRTYKLVVSIQSKLLTTYNRLHLFVSREQFDRRVQTDLLFHGEVNHVALTLSQPFSHSFRFTCVWTNCSKSKLEHRRQNTVCGGWNHPVRWVKSVFLLKQKLHSVIKFQIKSSDEMKLSPLCQHIEIKYTFNPALNLTTGCPSPPKGLSI